VRGSTRLRPLRRVVSLAVTEDQSSEEAERTTRNRASHIRARPYGRSEPSRDPRQGARRARMPPEQDLSQCPSRARPAQQTGFECPQSDECSRPASAPGERAPAMPCRRPGLGQVERRKQDGSRRGRSTTWQGQPRTTRLDVSPAHRVPRATRGDEPGATGPESLQWKRPCRPVFRRDCLRITPGRKRTHISVRCLASRGGRVPVSCRRSLHSGNRAGLGSV
jgi:hypothetical protein